MLGGGALNVKSYKGPEEGDEPSHQGNNVFMHMTSMAGRQSCSRREHSQRTASLAGDSAASTWAFPEMGN